MCRYLRKIVLNFRSRFHVHGDFLGSFLLVIEHLDTLCPATAGGTGDATAIEITATHPGMFGDDPVAAVEEAASWGVHRLVIPAFLFAKQPDAVNETIPLFMDKLRSS